MSKTICIDCDRRELRVVVGNSGLTGVSVEQLLSTTLEIPLNEDFLDNPKTTSALRELLKVGNVRAGNAIVTIPRGSVELRTIQVPTADKNELPDMVRFAAQRHFATIGDHWPIDFITLGTTPEGMTEVLASSINPARIDRVHKLVESMGLKLNQIVLRPMVASAVALLKKPELKDQCSLFIDLLSEEADMAIVDGKHVVFMRTIRFDSSLPPESRWKTLGGEIKRTLLSAISQNNHLSPTRILLWGSETEYADVLPELAETVGLPVESLNPLDLVDSSTKVRGDAGEKPGKYAAAIGGLLAPHYHENLIDFAHPRKREVKQTPVRQYAIAGAIAALLLGYLAFSYFSTHAELNAEKAELTSAINANNDLVKRADEKSLEWKKIETFLAGNYQWLDELDYLSEKAISADEAIFGAATFALESRGGEATIGTSFVTTKAESASALQESLRDESHEVKTTSIKPSNGQRVGYPLAADLTVRIQGNKVEDPRKWPTPPTPQTPSEAPPTEVPTTPPATAETPATAPAPAPTETPATTPAQQESPQS